MSVFNSLGSNYSNSFTRRASFGWTPRRAANLLRERLINQFGAQVIYLTFKGREALALILRELDLPKDSVVAITGYTCYAVYAAVRAAGHEVHYLDIEQNGLNFSPGILRQGLKTNPSIKAVIIQNTFGFPAEIEEIERICAKEGIIIIEDLAHCVGMNYEDGRKAGTVGRGAAFSFGQDKMVDAVSGGAATFQWQVDPTKALASVPIKDRFVMRIYPAVTFCIRATVRFGIGKVLLKGLKSLRLLPGPMAGSAEVVRELPKWHCKLVGWSLDDLEDSIVHRRKIAEVYKKILPEQNLFLDSKDAIYLRFPVRADNPRGLIEYLKQYDVYVGDRWYDAPVAPASYLSRTDYKTGQCPNAEQTAREMVNLPTHRYVTEMKAKFIARRVSEWLESSSKK